MTHKDSPTPFTSLNKTVDEKTVDVELTLPTSVASVDKAPSDGIVTLAIQELQNKFSQTEAFDLVDAVKIAMLFVEKQPIKGEQQRTVVVKALDTFINQSSLPVSIKDYYNNMINTGTVGKTIDLIIAATKGQLDLNKPENQQEIAKVASNCLVACLMSCLGRKKTV